MNALLAILSLVSTALCLAALVRLHVLPTGYRPISNAVSDYGVGPYKRYYAVQTSAIAVAALFLAAALWRETHPAPLLIVALLLVFAAARLLIPADPTDLDRSRPTRTGRRHVLLAGLAFGSIAWAAAALPSHVDWPGLHSVLVIVGWVNAGSAIACGLCMSSLLHRATEPFFGLVERIFYASMLAWFAIVAIHLLAS